MASSLPPRRSSSASYLKEDNAGPARRHMGFKERPSRNVPSAISNGEANGGTPSTSVGGGGSAPPVVEFSWRDDVDRLFAEKMKGKSKYDYKMSEYIKKLRACIRWYMELEDGYLAEQEKLRGSIDAENTRHTELEAQLSNAIEELKAANLDLTRRCQSLELRANLGKQEKSCFHDHRRGRQAIPNTQYLHTPCPSRRGKGRSRVPNGPEELCFNSFEIVVHPGLRKPIEEYHINIRVSV